MERRIYIAILVFFGGFLCRSRRSLTHPVLSASEMKEVNFIFIETVPIISALEQLTLEQLLIYDKHKLNDSSQVKRLSVNLSTSFVKLKVQKLKIIQENIGLENLELFHRLYIYF